MAEGLDTDAMKTRFSERAAAVKNRNLPPVGGEERQAFLRQAEQDFMDFSLIADSEVSLDGGILTFTVDLRPKAD